jgi:hypothetical protein
MPLTAEQQQLRRGKLTASRVAVLMRSDVEGIYRLWLEMTDQAEPENLDHIWAVQLGAATEQLNLDWYEEKNAHIITRRGDVVTHPDYEWAACTLDGWINAAECPIETKHTGGREPLEVIIERYWPQMGWQMFITGAKQCALSVIMGASEPIVKFIERDQAAEEYIQEMLARGQQFMASVEQRIPPVDLPPVAAPIVATKTYDLSADNIWVSNAIEWIETKPYSDRCKDAEKTLKSRVPEDAVKTFGAGVRITRDSAGRLSLREDK